MRKFWALTRREVSAILLSAPILLATAFFVLLDSFAFYLAATREAVVYAVFDDMAMFMLFTSLLLFPLITMQSFAEENARGTLETLLTAPVGNFTAVLAKFTGAMIYVVLYLLHGLVYAVLLSFGGNLDWNATLAAFLALFMVGALAMSLGVFVSSLTVSPAASVAGTAGLLIFMAVAADIDPYASGIAEVVSSISFVPHAKRWIAGEIDTRGLVYFVSATCLWLFYAWMSVGSRSLDRRGSNPTARRRMKVTYVLMTAAFLLLLLQVAYLHIRGFWETATPIGPALSRIPALWATPLVLSLVCLGWSILTYRAARRAEMRNRRRVVKYATISETRVMGASRYYYEENVRTRRLRALAAVAALVIVLNLNWLAQYPFRTFSDSAWFSFLTAFQDRHWDVSWDKRNSLSPATIRALDGLQGRVTVYSFLPYDAEVREVPVGDELRRLLQRYGDYNSLVTVAFADPGREPELAEEMAAEIGLQPDEVAGMVVVNYQGRRNLISGSSLVAPPDWRAQAAGETLWVFDGENKLTQAVMRLSDPRVPQVYFTVGHRELSLTPGMHPDRSVSKFSRALESANMRVRTHLILASRPIPPECDILVIASPMSPFVEYEVEDVERFLAEGGRLLYLAPAASESFSFRTDAMEPLLRTLGGSIRDDLLRDSAVRPDDPHSYPKGKAAGTGDEALTFVFPMARTIRDNPLSIERGWSCERLVESLSSSFSMPFGGGVMRQGPFTMLYRSAKMMEAGEARAVVAACGLMASDSDIGRGENETLLVALTQWLAGREDPPIAPRTWTDRRLKLVGPQMRLILWIGVVALPLIWFLAGISVWWLRRE